MVKHTLSRMVWQPPFELALSRATTSCCSRLKRSKGGKGLNISEVNPALSLLYRVPRSTLLNLLSAARGLPYCMFALNIFSVFVFCACFGMLLKGMVESCLLSKYESLTSNIDGVMAL